MQEQGEEPPALPTGQGGVAAAGPTAVTGEAGAVVTPQEARRELGGQTQSRATGNLR